MSEDKPTESPFKLNRGRMLLLVMGVVLVLIAVSTWMGGINAYQQLKQANAEATSAAPTNEAADPAASP